MLKGGETVNKGILLMDYPDSCDECPCFVPSCGIDFDLDQDMCGATDNITHGYSMPDWCPVQPMPQKIQHKSRQSLAQEQFEAGWNACVEKILGE